MSRIFYRVSALGPVACVVLLCYVKGQWPARPTGTVFTIKPIEAHAKIAMSRLQSGDTLVFTPDGVKHYWRKPLDLHPTLTNVTFHLGGMNWCIGLDREDCDVVIWYTPWDESKQTNRSDQESNP